ncbi:MAG: nitroreductase family protein [Planctomycetes bacterium]|nr:nitroreductase family protein [Planctomycetota bacterium]
MDFFEVIRSRRSCREFSDRAVDDQDIEACLEAARQAPSGTNSQPWRFFVCTRPETRAALAAAGYNQPCLRLAPVITVLLGDRGIYKKRLRRAKELADIGAVTGETLSAIERRYREKPEGAREGNDQAIRLNCMLAGEHYVLAAAALGLGCCWVMMFDAEVVAQALQLDPKYNFPVALLPTGHPAGAGAPPRPRYSLADIAWRDEAGRPWTGRPDQ